MFFFVDAIGTAAAGWVRSNPDASSQADGDAHAAGWDADRLPHANAGQQDPGRGPAAKGQPADDETG